VEAFRDSVREEIASILSPDFKVIVSHTDTVPSIDDPELTYPNLDTKEQKCKLIETCILHVDIRESTAIGERHQREELVGLYSAFVRAMSRCAAYNHGKVRNIIGDRVMVLFDKANCFTNAVNTAILMNTVAKFVLDKEFKIDNIKCGIGIDYGYMLIAKAGVIKKGEESVSSRSLVWLGRPANVASKLADKANKTETEKKQMIREGCWYESLNQWSWYDFDINYFLGELQITNSPILRHKDENFRTFTRISKDTSTSNPAILVTDSVFSGYKVANPNANSIVNDWWKKQPFEVSGYRGDIYGSSLEYASTFG